MKFLKSYFIIALVCVLSFSCEENEYEDVQTPEAISFNQELAEVSLETSSDSYQLKVEATTISNQDRTVSIEVVEESLDGSAATTADASTYTLGSNQIVIPAGSYIGFTDVTFDFENLAFSSPYIVVFQLSDDNVETFNVTRTNSVLEFERTCPLTLATLTISTDDFPEETLWELYDFAISTSDPISQGGPFPGQTNTNIEIPWCLDTGSYGVIVRDTYGDGITGGGFTVSVGGAVITSGTVGASASPGSQPSFGSATFEL